MSEYDLVIANGQVVDGLGDSVPYAPWRRADVAVCGDRIVFVGSLDKPEAKEVLDARGLIVCPGFIDIHSHSDAYLLANPKAESKVRQGVTTEVLGNCGLSAAPILGEYGASPLIMPDFLMDRWPTLDLYLAALAKNGIGVNALPLVGHCNIRGAVLGCEPGEPSHGQLGRMKLLLREALDAGAWGMSAGLVYPPGSFSSREELIELCKLVCRYNGVFHIHMRGQGDGLLAAAVEALEIAQTSGVRMNIHHHKGMGDHNAPKIMLTLPMFEEAIAGGTDVTMDMYPYSVGQGDLASFLPPWVHEGGAHALVERLKSRSLRERIEREMIEPGLVSGYQSYLRELGWDSCWEHVLICGCRNEKNRSLVGLSIQQATPDWQEPVGFVFDLLVKEGGSVPVLIPDTITLDDRYLQVVLRHPVTMFGSDGFALAPYGPLGEGLPHPRSYGTFPRVLGRLVRQRRLFSWQEAIRKMSSAPARFLGIQDRGVLKEGAYADITVFDPERVIDRATFDVPHQYPSGIEYVVVNGVIVVRQGEHTGALPGRVLQRE